MSGAHLPVDDVAVTIGGRPARVVFAAPTRLVVTVPSGLDGGRAPIRVSGLPRETVYVDVGVLAATGLHQVDSPVFDRDGNLFVTYSGARGQECPVSVFRVTPSGSRDAFVSGIVNATSMTMGPDGRLYVSSRFAGAVYRIDERGRHERVAGELGVACGIVFDREGRLYVGDRAGTIFRVIGSDVHPFASIPASVAAFHLAMSPTGDLFVTGPTLGTRDPIYRIDSEGCVDTLPASFGRPQGLACGPDGALYVVDALAGISGLYRVDGSGRPPELVVSGPSMIGVAFGPSGQLAVASSDSLYVFDDR